MKLGAKNMSSLITEILYLGEFGLANQHCLFRMKAGT